MNRKENGAEQDYPFCQRIEWLLFESSDISIRYFGIPTKIVNELASRFTSNCSPDDLASFEHVAEVIFELIPEKKREAFCRGCIKLKTSNENFKNRKKS